MNRSLQVFYEQMNFDSLSKLYLTERLVLPFPDDMEEWSTMLSRQIECKGSTSIDKNEQRYYVLLEFIKSGAKQGYLVLAIPVIIDIPDEQSNIVYLLPNITDTISLNAEYYLGDHNNEPEDNRSSPKIQLNDVPLSQEYLSLSQYVGTAESWFEAARQYLYNSCNVNSLKALQDKLQDQLKNQQVYPQLSLVKKSDEGAKKQLLNLYEGLLSDGSQAYQHTALPKLLSAYDNEAYSGLSVDCTTNDLYHKLLTTSQGSYDPNMPYLLGHMDTQKSNKAAQDNDASSGQQVLTIANSRELLPLDNTQRHASLAAAYLDNNYQENPNRGRVLAVNGPPGSGKTSMLKAVVAHFVVKAALLKEPCPIIVASGATNQSVKNVTSAFPDVVQEDNEQYLIEYQRWIPHCPTYGSFFASSDAESKLSDQEKGQIPILEAAGIDKPYNFGWKGVGSQLNDLHANNELSAYYLSKAKIYFKQQGLPEPVDIASAIHGLHALLADTYQQMAWALYTAKTQLFSGNADLSRVFPVEYEDQHLASFLSIKKDLIELYKENSVAIYERVCRERIRDENINPEDYPRVLRQTALNILIEQCIDLEYRAKLFHLAARYWEGHFIIDQKSNLHFSRTEDNIIAGLRRVCMITPVIISTVNRLPQLLKIGSYPPGAPQKEFAYGGIDLLITDESGQATIMAALPIAGLTKRLVSVGDVLQLAPVIDTKADVSAFDEYLIWLKNGYTSSQVADLFARQLSVSHGSFLHVVQAASSLNYQGNGFMLRGHYRCYQNIIEYCNRLVYDNKLFYIPPLNKDLRQNGLPAMAYIESTGLSTKGSGNVSKANSEEAKMIAQLVIDNYTTWQDLLGKDGNKPRLQDMVAIITPFNRQPEVIKNALLEENANQGNIIPRQEIEETIINTIHTLQGAEKDIVIYSGVQSHEDNATLFFENQPYLLNVAVSRAKKSFIALLSPTLYRLNDPKLINDPNYKSSNSVHYLGWYMANHGMRLLPNYLFIVEAPGKLKSLQKILKGDYILHATSGAITNLELRDASIKTAGQQLRPQYKLLPNGKQALDIILEQGPRVKKIYLATDDDNVGETIAWHLLQAIKREAPELADKTERVALRAITQEDVEQALINTRDIDEHRVAAEIARDIIDKWLAQYMMQVLSNNLPLNHAGRSGMGRVQATIIDLIAKHEAYIKQRNGNSLKVTLTVNGRKLTGQMQNVPEDYIKIVKDKVNETKKPITAKTEKYQLEDVLVEEVVHEPFNRSTLGVISLAWQRYRMDPATTMRILQRLYEGDV